MVFARVELTKVQRKGKVRDWVGICQRLIFRHASEQQILCVELMQVRSGSWNSVRSDVMLLPGQIYMITKRKLS